VSAAYDYGPLQTWQVIWRNGHVEEVQAHQCLLPPTGGFLLFSERPDPREGRLTFHGEIDGRWKLVLDVDYAEVLSVRLVTQPEVIPGGAS
jgi:hypothetical protein